ncbi:hypothetical protein LCGC14_0428600 [marine sediment metagenome]|uniref:PD-(D/E)XK endonuclease-like domain-containing protein n=1 Tax=marine sediment metagenome TaxID=412755 RepID=A0A0F9SNS7_9ZZZZ
MAGLSPSGVNLYQACELKFDHRYNQDAPGRMKPDYYAGGSLFHSWTDAYGKYLAANGKKFDRDQAALISNEMPEGVSLELYEDIQELFIGWSNKKTFTDPTRLRTEMKLAINSEGDEVEWDSPEAAIRMVIDVVEMIGGELIITDYKTGRQIKPINKVAGKTYAYGVWVKLGGEFTKIRYIEEYPRYNKTQELEITQDDISSVPAFYVGKAKEIEAKTEWLPAGASGECVDCEAAHLCPVYKAEVEDNDLAITSPEDAVALAQKVFTSNLRNGKAKEMLKAYSDANGAIVFADEEFGPVPEEKVKWYDLSTLLDYFTRDEEDDGAELSWPVVCQGLSLSKSGLEKIYKATGLKGEDLKAKVYELIKAYGQLNVATKFTFHNAK